MKKNYLLILLLILSVPVVNAQIPNYDFENWTNMGTYSNPDNWDTFNDTSSLAGIFSCTKGAPGTNGSATYIKLTTKVIPIVGTVVPGIAVCGTINTTTLKPGSGFPFTGRPQALTGDWQYSPSVGDQGFVAAVLTKWNSGSGIADTIAVLLEPLAGSVVSWASMNLQFTYLSGLDPDTAVIVLASSGATGSTMAANSYIYVDNLAFIGNVAGVNDLNVKNSMNTFPNPVRDLFYINNLNSKSCHVEISDIRGRIVYSSDMKPENGRITLDASSFPAGNYSILTSEGTTQHKSEIVKVD